MYASVILVAAVAMVAVMVAVPLMIVGHALPLIGPNMF
jgi:hypothetical protein